MEKDTSLKRLEDFVELCNKCNYDKYLSKENCDKGATQLANDFLTLMKDENAIIKDKDNKDFYDYLREKNVKDRYVFCQDSNIVAKVNVFEPFVKDEDGNDILNQKWHTLISFLAYLDYMNYKKCNKNSIEGITVWENKNGKQRVSIYFACKGRKTFNSVGMCDWIFHAVGKSE